jgi:hypothetical protein
MRSFAMLQLLFSSYQLHSFFQIDCMLPVDHTAGNLIAGSINWSCLLPDSMEL